MVEIAWRSIAPALVTTGTVLAVAAPLVKPWLERLVDRRLHYESASRLESHKQKLDVVTEEARYDLQKKLANVSLLTSRRHDAYAEAYRACREAHGLILNQRGFRSYPTFEEYNEADVEAYLAVRDAPKGFIREIVDLWARERKQALSKLGPYVRMLDLQAAQNSFARAKNSFYLNELYFSESVIEKCNDFVDAGAVALAELEYPSPTSNDWQDAKTRFDLALEALHTTMRIELSAG